MPIKPENAHRYPKDWKHIAASIRERAGHRCEWDGCGARNYSFGHWVKHPSGIMVWCPAHDDERTPRSFAEARQAAAEWMWEREHIGTDKPVVIVLTVAHLDHTPENCTPENLRAWCQRHHLAYDHQHHQRNAQATRRAKVGQEELF
jgi:hypothetical protein